MNRLDEVRSRLRRTLPSSERSRYLLACAGGSGIGGILFTWMLTAGSWDLFRWQKMASFYDAQAHALLNGRWDVPQQVLGIESFTVHGKSYLYQGPVPALLRMPIVAFGDRLDGRLTQLSMLAAYVVIMMVVGHMSLRLRCMVRGDEPVTGVELVGLAGFMALLGGGSSLLYLASRAWVYHEALIWGVAFSIAAIDTLLGYLIKPSGRRLTLLSVLTTAALLSRASIGLGPLVALALLCGLGLLKARPWRSLPRHRMAALKSTWHLAVAPAAPLGIYALINFVKFETLFSIPFATQGFTLVDPARQQMLAANNGTLFGLKFIPTTMWHYLNPAALGFSRRFPFIDFPPIPGRVIGDVQFDLLDRTASVPASLPILCLLALVGVAVIVRVSRSDAPGYPSIRLLRIPLIGVTAGGLTILPFGYIAHRYLADLFPLLALTSIVGFHVLDRWRVQRPRIGAVGLDRIVMAVMAVMVGLGLITFAINLSLALVFQRAFSSDVPPSRVAGLVGFQEDLDGWMGRRLGGFRPPSVQVHDELPSTGASGTLVVVGDCEGLYLNDGMIVNSVKRTPWVPVERTAATGLHRAMARFNRRPTGATEVVVNFRDGSAEAAVTATHVDAGHLRFALSGSSRFGFEARMLPVPFDPDHTYVLEVVADPRLSSLIVRLDDRIVLETFYWYEGDGLSFPSRFRELPVRAELCQKVRAAAGLASSP